MLLDHSSFLDLGLKVRESETELRIFYSHTVVTYIA
jgi:hypothetical protein